jgi:surface antigen
MRQTKQKRTAVLRRLRSTPLLVVVSAVLVAATLTHGFGFAASCVSNDDCQAQINDLNSKNAQAQGVLNGLESQAASFQDTINALQTQINALQTQIAANQAQQASLQQQITEKQQEIDQQKEVLGNDVKTMYLSGQLTPQEMLATSNSLSDYIDKQEAYSAVQDKIQNTLQQIQALQKQLQIQKVQIDTLIASQQSQQSQLASTQTQQQSLLNYNQDQQNQYDAQISANSGQISQLRAAQIILNSKYNIGNFKGDPNNGGYPSAWANAPQDSMIDSWGMYNRECVSYTAFMVHQEFLAGQASHDMPWWGGVGNANQWDDDARAAGIPVDTNPTVGSIAISNAGFYGHAMYVAAVSGNTIYVQQYNANLNGQYSEGWRYTTGLVFIHF